MAGWAFDTAHSEVGFSVRHMMISKVRGSFSRWKGSVSTSANGALAGVDVEVEIDSIDTREAQRDGHLKSPDFFNAAAFPTMRFVSSSVTGDTDGDFQIHGQLTIRDVTRDVTLSATFNGGGKDPWGNTRKGYHATTSINRTDFGLTWNQALELGGVLVGEKVEISLDIQLIAV